MGKWISIEILSLLCEIGYLIFFFNGRFFYKQTNESILISTIAGWKNDETAFFLILASIHELWQFNIYL